MNLQESIRRILREDKKTKSTNKEFSKYKDSKFNSLRDYTLQDIVNNWESLSDHKNENIKTIRHFIDNPDKITDLVYDGKGLEDGYHRLIAAKILKKPKFTYRLVENLQESIKRILKEETNIKPVLHDLLNMLFDGFDDIYYDWAEYNCGMGVCCDPYAVGFVLPKSDYDDYLFKLVDDSKYDIYGDYPKELSEDLPEPCHEYPDVRDPRFDTIVFYEIFAEEIENYLGSQSNWQLVLMELINEKYHCNAENILII